MNQLIAVDLDGTLLNADSVISAENAAAVKRAQTAGMTVIIATGRAYFDAWKKCRQAGLDVPIISCSGANIHDAAGQLLFSIAIEPEDIANAIDWLETRDMYYEICNNEAIYTTRDNKRRLTQDIQRLQQEQPDKAAWWKWRLEVQFSQHGFVMVERPADLVANGAALHNLVAVTVDQELRAEGFRYFGSRSRLTVFASDEYNFELTHRQASKGNAVAEWARRQGFSLADTVALGDSYNDLPMLQMVGHGVAMGNARPEVKAVCRYQAADHTEDGVAQVIDQLLAGTFKDR